MDEEELKRQILQKKLEEEQTKQVLKVMVSQILEQKASERLSNLRLVRPDLASQLELYLVQLYQTGQIKQRITEEQIITILSRLGKKHDIKIKRK